MARLVVADFHSPAEAARAADAFDARFSRGELAVDDLPVVTVTLAEESVALSRVLVDAGLAASGSEGARKIQQGGVKVNRQKVSDPKLRVGAADFPMILEAGRRAVRVVAP